MERDDDDQAKPGSDHGERRRWHVKREISLGDLLAIGLAAIALVASYSNLDKRITRLEDGHIIQREVDKRQDEESLRNQVRVEVALQSLASKIERLLERVK